MSSSSSSSSGGAGFVAFGRSFLLRKVFADPIDIGEDGPVRARIGRPQVNDVTEQNLAGQELVTPDDDGLNGERAFAQACDHRLAAGLDALGDRDFALAGQKLDRAHLAQVHAHRIVGAVGRLLGGSLAHRDRVALGGLDEVTAVGFLLLGLCLLPLVQLFGLDDADAHCGELAKHVLDLLGREVPGGQTFV